jgi:hypothetical protein
LKIEAVLVVLLDFPTGFGCDLGFSDRLLEGGEWAARLWSKYGEAVTLRHIAKRPGSRPMNWYRYDAPQHWDSSTETQLAYLTRLDLLTDEEKARVPHVRPRLARPRETGKIFPVSSNAPAQPVEANGLNSPAPSGWELVLVDGRVELVRAGTR